MLVFESRCHELSLDFTYLSLGYICKFAASRWESACWEMVYIEGSSVGSHRYTRRSN